MLTRDDLVDLIMAHLGAAPKAEKARRDEPCGRVFLSEREIKKRLIPGEDRLRIPKEAILSPLASDWLVLGGIKIIRE